MRISDDFTLILIPIVSAVSLNFLTISQKLSNILDITKPVIQVNSTIANRIYS